MVNKEYYKLGQKIRNFRIRSGKSQMDLELEIGASSGSLSRIENGEVNPTKETLLKIVNHLSLNVSEALTLYSLDFLDFPRLWKVASDLSQDLDFDKTMQNAVNIITKEMNFFGGVIFRYNEKNKELIPWFHNNTKTITMLASLLAKPFRDYVYNLNLENSPIIESFNNNKVILSQGIDSLAPVVESSYIKKVTEWFGLKKSLSIPIYKENVGLGVLWFGFTREIISEEELRLLKELSDYIATAISNSIKYENALNK